MDTCVHEVCMCFMGARGYFLVTTFENLEVFLGGISGAGDGPAHTEVAG